VAAPGGRGVVDVRIDEAELARLTRSASGPVVMAMARLGERATQLAKAAAPVGDRSSKTLMLYILNVPSLGNTTAARIGYMLKMARI
jgi:hypothetical protein